MAINRNVLAEKQATVLSEDGNTMYATIQMRHGKESEMDKSKFVPAEMGVATDTKKAFMAFGPNQVKEIMFREDSEIEELLGEVREISDKAVEAVESAEATAKQTIQDFTDQMKATIPEDYTETVKKVDILERNTASAIYKTASGESLQIEDSADAPVAGLKVFGRSEQVQTTGAQLLDESIFNNLPHDTNVIYKPIRVQNNGEYTLSTDMDTGKASTNLFLLSGNVSTGANSSTNGAYKDHPITVQSSDNYVTVGYRYGTVSPLNPKDYHNMLNSGSTALLWEPYTGGVPGPNPDYPQDIEIPGSDGEIGIVVHGKNFIDLNLLNVRKSKVNIEIQGSVIKFTPTANGNAYAGNINTNDSALWPYDKQLLIPVNGISEIKYLISNPYFNDNYVQFYDSNYYSMSYKQYRGNSGTIEVQDQSAYMAFRIGNAFAKVADGTQETTVMIYNPIYNEEFEPFKSPQTVSISSHNGLPGIPVDSGGNYTDADGQQWICDEVDFERGKYVQRVQKVVYDGSELWNKTGIYVERYYRALNPNGLPNQGLSNYFVYLSGGETAGKFTINNDGTGVSFAFKTVGAGTSVEDWKDWLNQRNIEGKPLILYYCLLNPIETDLSKEELAAYAVLRTNYPTTVVTSDADPAVDMEIEYVADTKTYIDNKFAELAQNLAATQNTLLEV